jgi:hypothetical protein
VTLTIERVPIDSLTPSEKNPRRGNVEAIADSLNRFGQVRPILAQAGTRRIVAGHHTWRAAKDVLGWTEIDVVLREMSDAEANAYMVADNRLSDIGTNDDEALMQLLSELEESGELVGTGYTSDDVEDLRSLLGAVETEAEPFEGGYAEMPDDKSEGTRGAGPMPMREVVILMTVEQADDFGRRVKRLESAYGTTGVAATIREAVRRETQRLDA